MVLDEERRNTPPGYRHEPHNKTERNKAAASNDPGYEPYKDPTPSKAKLSEKLVGKPVYSEGTISSAKDEPLKDGTDGPNTIDTVTEARLGGGEETLYSPEDGPPLHHSAPKPCS